MVAPPPPAPQADLELRLRALLAAHGPALARLVRGYERDADRGRDLYQDIAAALWRSLPSFQGQASEKTWVLRVAHNVAVDHVVRQKTLRQREGEPLETAPEQAAGPRGEDAIDARRSAERLIALVRALRPPDRQLVLLYLEGLSPAEISDVTGMSATNVTSKMHRLRAALRAEMEGAT